MKSSARPNSCAKVVDQVEHLGLDRHVERRHWLVGDDEARVGDDRASDADPLTLATGELVRVAVERGAGSSPTSCSTLCDSRPPIAA